MIGVLDVSTPPPPIAGKARKRIGIEKLLEWAFGAEKAQLDPPGTFADSQPFGVSTLYILQQRKLMGCRIDGGRGFIAPAVAEDAETVAAVVAGALDWRMATLVAEYGRTGQRPIWLPDSEPKPEPRLGWFENQFTRRGKDEYAGPGVWVGGWGRISQLSRGRKTVHESRIVPLTYSPSRQQIERTRADYMAWWSAIHAVREMLLAAPVLRDHELTGELPPSQPWNDPE